MRRKPLGRLTDEGGYALVSAIILMGIIAGVAMTLLSWTDGQQRESGTSRTREAAFNLSESALNAQVQALSRTAVWPRDSTKAIAPCTQASTSSQCPTADAIQSMIASPDTSAGVAYTTEVRDNSGPAGSDYFSETETSSAHYDANGDGKLWVKAQVTAGGKTRTIVTLVQRELVGENFPHAAVLAGKLDISNQGNKIIIDGTGAASGTKIVAVRCAAASGEGSPCLGHALGTAPTQSQDKLDDLLDKQISPNVTEQAYAGGNAIDEAAKERLRQTAIADGTYYSSCPASLPNPAQVTWIENGNCSFQANGVYNSATAPGLLVIENGTLSINGTFEYYGVIYAANAQNTTGAVIDVAGQGTIYGGVIIDGQGTLIAGSSKLNIRLSEDAFNNIKSYGSAGLVQSTWREIQG